MWYTVVVSQVDDGIVAVLSHALEGAKAGSVLSHSGAGGGVQVAEVAIVILEGGIADIIYQPSLFGLSAVGIRDRVHLPQRPRGSGRAGTAGG